MGWNFWVGNDSDDDDDDDGGFLDNLIETSQEVIEETVETGQEIVEDVVDAVAEAIETAVDSGETVVEETSEAAKEIFVSTIEPSFTIVIGVIDNIIIDPLETLVTEMLDGFEQFFADYGLDLDQLRDQLLTLPQHALEALQAFLATVANLQAHMGTFLTLQTQVNALPNLSLPQAMRSGNVLLVKQFYASAVIVQNILEEIRQHLLILIDLVPNESIREMLVDIYPHFDVWLDTEPPAFLYGGMNQL